MKERNDYHKRRMFDIDRDNKAENDMKLILEKCVNIQNMP
jgi:hypothetical protein